MLFLTTFKYAADAALESKVSNDDTKVSNQWCGIFTETVVPIYKIFPFFFIAKI